MPYISSRGKDFALVLDEKTYNEMGFNTKKSLDIIKIKSGVWVFVERDTLPEKPEKSEKLKESVLQKLLKARLSDRVIDRFEKLLSENEKNALKELILEKKIIEFKLSDKYRKAIYKVADSSKGSKTRNDYQIKKTFSGNKNFYAKKNISEDYSLERNGFMIVKNEAKAKQLSFSLSDKIKKKQVYGTKSFDGNYYLINSWKYKKVEPKILGFIIKKKEAALNELTSELKIPKEMIKVVCEFLREKGEILEKRKELYKYIE